MSYSPVANQNLIGKKRTHSDYNSDTMENKRIKNEAALSKVLHIRQIAHDATESDLRVLGTPFGTVKNVLHMRSKNQAFLEMDSIDSAKTLINYYQYTTPTIRNMPVFIQFSQHQELRTNQQQPKEESANGVDSHEANGCVLKVIVTNIMYPVNIDVLKEVFQRCGELQKMVTFIRNDQFHALIQYANPKEASAAKTLFDRQNIYNGCNTLHVEFSKMTELTVKYNNEKMRDFTKPDVAIAQMGAMHSQMNPGMLPVPASFPPQMFQQNLGFTGNFPHHMMGNLSPNSQISYQPHMISQNMGNQRQGSVLLVSHLNEEKNQLR